MSVLETVATDLAAIGDGLTRARTAAADADHAAQQIAARAASSGFAGIAQNISRLRQTLQDVSKGIDTAKGTTGEGAAAVAGVAKQATPQETSNALGPLTQKLDDLHGQIGAVLEHLTKAQQLTSAVLQGGQPAPMLARLGAIRQILLTVVQRENQAKQNVNIALAEARKAGDQGN